MTERQRDTPYSVPSTEQRRGIKSRAISFYGGLLVIAPLTYLVHEAAHWLTGTALGHDMSFSINGVSPAGAITAHDHLLISAAGPLMTLVQEIIAFLLVRSRDSVVAYGVLFFALMMRPRPWGSACST